MTWEEKVPGKWSSDRGYAIRFRDETWLVFTPQGVPLSVGEATFEDAQAAADAHYAASL